MFRLALIHLRRYIKNPIMMFMMLPLPLGLVIMSVGFGSSHSLDPKVAIVIQEHGIYETKLIEALELNDTYVYLQDSDVAIEKLKANDLAGIIMIPQDFSSKIENGVKPSIDVIKTSKGAGTFWAENIVEKQVNNYLKASYDLDETNSIVTNIKFIEEKSDGQFLIFIMMVIYFIFIGGTTLARDVMMLKNQKILTRSLSTANKNHQIMGGLIIAMSVIQGTLFTIVYYIGAALLNIRLTNIFLPILLMFSMSFVAASLVIFITRMFKNQTMIEMSLIIYTLASFLICLVAMNFLIASNDNTWLINIAKLFPMYWAFDTAYNQTLWPNIPIIMLFATAFLTAGSLKLHKFAQ